MTADLWALYRMMLRCRLFEEAVGKLWQEGLITGEMHLGNGEEGIVAGVLAHVRDGDALALDHRGSAALLLRGVDPVAMLRELLGRSDGLCGGMGGHMHLFSKEHLAATSGIVGAGGPAAAGFGLAAQMLHPGAIAVTFFGEGAMNQGMLLEALNLSAAWNLPALFVCKDDGWAITTASEKTTGGSLSERARAFGLYTLDVDGTEAAEVWEAAGTLIESLRNGGGPTFLHARCVHFEGHFLGFQLLRMARDPLKEMPAVAGALTGSFLHPGGAGLGERIKGLQAVMGALSATQKDARQDLANDPVRRMRASLEADRPALRALEDEVFEEISGALQAALREVGS